jgi:hypothetical protein
MIVHYPLDDWDWFAIDEKGHIAHFASSGSGGVPQIITEDVDGGQTQTAAYLSAALPVTQIRVLHAPYPDMSDFIYMAERGLFSYDFISKDNQPWTQEGIYRQLVRPVMPIFWKNLPVTLQRELQPVHFARLSFEKSAYIKFENK